MPYLPLEVAFAEKVDNVLQPIVAADGATFTEVLRITVPNLPRPVWIEGQLVAQATAAGTVATVVGAIGPVGMNLFTVLDATTEVNVGGPSGANAEADGRKFPLFKRRLPPRSGGQYILGAVRATGSAAAGVVGTTVVSSWLSAVRV